MKIKAVAVLAKEYRDLTILDTVGRQWINLGGATYPLDGMPKLNEDTIFAVLDVPVGERSGYEVRREPLVGEKLIAYTEDNQDGDTEAELVGMIIKVNNETVRPVYTTHGIVCIRNDAIKPTSDSGKMARYFARVVDGKTVILIKNGFQLVASITPIGGWAQDNVLEWLGDLRRHAAHLNNEMHEQWPDDARYTGNEEG